MDTTPPKSSPTTSVCVTSPLFNAKILQVPLDSQTMTSQAVMTSQSSMTNHRTTSPPSKIPQPIGSNHVTDLSTNHRGLPGRPVNLTTIKSPADLVMFNQQNKQNCINSLQPKVGNGPIAMTSEPQKGLIGPHATIVQPISSQANATTTVVTVQGPVPQPPSLLPPPPGHGRNKCNDVITTTATNETTPSKSDVITSIAHENSSNNNVICSAPNEGSRSDVIVCRGNSEGRSGLPPPEEMPDDGDCSDTDMEIKSLDLTGK